MATAALTLGIVGLFAWILPPLGFPISIIGIILAVIALIAKKHKTRATVGLTLCVIGFILNIVVTLVGVGAIGMLGILSELLPELYGPTY